MNEEGAWHPCGLAFPANIPDEMPNLNAANVVNIRPFRDDIGKWGSAPLPRRSHAEQELAHRADPKGRVSEKWTRFSA
jgi:hypothetical protein